jgi:hypothetical protein
VEPVVSFQADHLEQVAHDAAADLERLLGMPVRADYKEAAPIQLDGGISLVLIAIGSALGSGVGAAVGQDIWTTIKKVFFAGIGTVRSDDPDDTRRRFRLHVRWGDAGQHRMELISDGAPLEAVGALERLTATQLRPFEEIVIPALHQLQCSSLPPKEAVIQGWLGQGQHDDNLWQVRLTFSASAAPVKRPELIVLFAVGADGVIRWEGDFGSQIAEILATQQGV